MTEQERFGDVATKLLFENERVHIWEVLAAQEALEKLPKRDQRVAVRMVSEPGIDPKSAVKMLETLAEKPGAGSRLNDRGRCPEMFAALRGLSNRSAERY